MTTPPDDTPVKWNFPPIKRGDTFPAREVLRIEDDETGDPVPITAARLEIRTTSGVLVHRFATDDAPPTMEIIGAGNNGVMIQAVDESETATWPLGNHVYDLEVWTELFGKKTMTEGIIPCRADVTQNTPLIAP
jgi:hypothetical protein